jgi:deoxyribodipyrimidine photo-lyase
MTRLRREPPPAIVWFRDDLRLADNEALSAACAGGGPVLCIYILDEASAGLRPRGGAARWWLHHSLEALARDIEARAGRLDLFRGAASDIVPALAEKTGAGAAFWTRRYGGGEIAVDSALKTQLTEAGVRAQSFKGQLLHEPWEVRKGDGGAFMVYSAFARAAGALPDPGDPRAAPVAIPAAPYPAGAPAPVSLAQLALLPRKPDWARGLRASWTPGEDGARERLAAFIESSLEDYTESRDNPAEGGVSRLSPHLRFGEISPRQIVAAIREADAQNAKVARGADKFLSEILWREFDYHLLFSHPDVARVNLQPRFDGMPWRDPPAHELAAWRRGRTGYPLVDAGMRELWATGYMHNRVRMVAASFLVKHLLIDWRIGEDWFWDTLCDADPANNPLNWQWVAGCGADAAPYFRIFNPVLQGEKFDAGGEYVRRWAPELAALPDKWIHRPWLAPRDVLCAAGVEIGETYPRPIVDHAKARARALAAFAKVKGD